MTAHTQQAEFQKRLATLQAQYAREAEQEAEEWAAGEPARREKALEKQEAHATAIREEGPDAVRHALAGWGVPPEFQRATMQEFGLSECAQDVLHRVRAGEWIYLYAPWGVGKTHLVCALMADMATDHLFAAGDPGSVRVRVSREPQFLFVRVAGLLHDLQGAIGRGSEYHDVLDRIHATPLLILDDIGKRRATDWVNEVLFNIIDTRSTYDRQTILTSNLSLDKLGELMDGATVSRLAGKCSVVCMPGTDRRVQGRRS